MMNMRGAGFCQIAVCLLVMWMLAALPAAAETPEAAIAKVQTAVDTRDASLLQQYVDLPGIIGAGVDSYVQTLARSGAEKGGTIAPMIAMMLPSLQKNDSTAAAVRSMLIEETRSFVVYGVSSGQFAGKPVPGKAGTGMFAPLYADASLGRKEIRAVKNVRQQGKEATAQLRVYDFGSEREYPIDVRMADKGDHWQVVEVRNLSDLVGRLRKEAAENQ